MGRPLGGILVAVLLALAAERPFGPIARSRGRWVRYLRACPPSRLSDLPSRMIIGGQRRRRRARGRAERSDRTRPPSAGSSEFEIPIVPEWRPPAELPRPAAPVATSRLPDRELPV